MKQTCHFAALIGLMTLSVLLSGCGESKVKISGKLLKGGQPLSVPNDTQVTLTFFPEDEAKQGQTYPASFKHEIAKYEVEMPPGKYRASYIIKPKEGELLLTPPEFRNKSFDLTKNQELDIDIAAK